jgi:hypothetical protein
VKHPNDAELLAYLDGELSWIQRIELNFHFTRCWQCRANKAALESQAHAISHALRPAGSATSARLRFEAWRWRYEQSIPTTHVAPHPWRYAPVLLVLPMVAAVLLWPEERPIAPPPPLPPAVPLPPVLHARAAMSPQPTSPQPQPLALELDVHYRLHRIGACAAEPVLILRKPGSKVEVSAVGPPRQREAEIREALADLAASKRIEIRITPPVELGVLAEGIGAPAPKAPVSQALLESPIAEKFPRFQESATAVLREADNLYAHAWALRRHMELPVDSGAADTNAYWLKHSMVTEHLRQLDQALARMQGELKPILRTSPVVERLKNRTVFDLANQLNLQLQHFFQSDSTDDLDPAAPGSEELWATLQALDLQLNKLAREYRMGRH